MFFGRSRELDQLRRLKTKKTASLVCLLGRRRVGKSTLIEKFAENFKSSIAIQGLGPESKQTNQQQLDNFAESLSLQLNSRREYFTDWSQAFHYLASKTSSGECIILLDEVSWMGRHDPLFATKLKSAWDQYFKKNSRLVLVICGSVSTWIEDNILNNTSFEGRVSLSINLEGLRLSEINKFWDDSNHHFGSLEKMLILSVTGGIPKYLEEIVRTEEAEKNIVKLCFSPAGLLFKEYETIFSDIFERRKKSLEKIVKICLETKLSPAQIAYKLGKDLDGHLTQLLHILELSGFASRDYYFNFDGSASKLSHIRIKDNYLRFYLKYIEPNKPRILKGGKVISSLFDLSGFEATLGYQFENLILANREQLYPILGISEQSIISSAPYVQRKGKSRRAGCQIDLLTHTDLDLFFLCEFKCRRVLDATIIGEVQRKMRALELPKRSALKPVLIYEGQIENRVLEKFNSFFFKLIPFSRLLQES